MPIDESFSTAAVSHSHGLSTGEAAARLEAEGYNELPQKGGRSAARILAEVLKEPMLALLLGAGLAYLFLGDAIEASILLLFACFSVAITAIQEFRSEKVLAALRDLSSPRALVIRNGQRLRIPGREVVRGDLIIVEEGDRIPADARLLSAHDLQLDESMLTGESLAVDKQPDDRVFSGTMAVRGGGMAAVEQIGAATQLGRIGMHLATVEGEPPRLRRETMLIVRVAGVGAILIAGSVVLLFGLFRGGWLDAVLAGIATGMAMLPEEFPVVLTTFLAMGAWRISQARVLTRKAAAIETLGSITILCTDKTGTLTENRMAVASLWLPDGSTFDNVDGGEPPTAYHHLLEAGILGSAAAPVDPMEQAIHRAGAAVLATDGAARIGDWRHVHHFGLRPELLAMSNVWQTDGPDAPLLLAAKGAPEAVARLCRLNPADGQRMLAAADAMARRGIRVLGVATAHSETVDRAGSQLDHAFTLLGLIGLADPLRTAAPAAVAECRAAGIKVAMITGDYAATAHAIAAQAGIDAQHVYARVTPTKKLEIVEQLKADGEIVAMTGDGVNDAPALKAAHVGIAMGGRGTDVAREAASLVLLDDEFGSIVKAVRLGRRIYDNIRKAMGFIVAVHVPIAGLSLLPLMFGLPILFGPIHIALLEMVIDPTCALVFEAEEEEEDIMRRPPRDPDQRLFSPSLIAWSLFEGGLALMVLTALYLAALSQGVPPAAIRAMVFVALVATILALIAVSRVANQPLRQALRHRNRPLLVIVAVVTAVVAAIALSADIRALLDFGPVGMREMAAALGSGTMLALLLQLLKPVARRIGRGRHLPATDQ